MTPREVLVAGYLDEMEKQAGVRRLDRLGKALTKRDFGLRWGPREEAINAAYERADLNAGRRATKVIAKAQASGAPLPPAVQANKAPHQVRGERLLAASSFLRDAAKKP